MNGQHFGLWLNLLLSDLPGKMMVLIKSVLRKYSWYRLSGVVMAWFKRKEMHMIDVRQA